MTRFLSGSVMATDLALLPSTVRNCHGRHRCPLLSLQLPAGVAYLTLR